MLCTMQHTCAAMPFSQDCGKPLLILGKLINISKIHMIITRFTQTPSTQGSLWLTVSLLIYVAGVFPTDNKQ